MALDINSNPDYYRYECKEQAANGQTVVRTTIYCSTAKGLILSQGLSGAVGTEHVGADQNLSVYALNLELNGPLSFPARDVLLVCKTLRIPADYKGGDQDLPGALLDVSAPALQPPYLTPWRSNNSLPEATAGDGLSGDCIGQDMNRGAGQAYGGDAKAYSFGVQGDAGGRIQIFCEQLELKGHLVLKADGAQGHSGCDGQNALADHFGGAGGRAGDGGDAGQISIQACRIDAPDLISYSAAPGAPGLPGAPGTGFSRDKDGAPAPAAEAGTSSAIVLLANAPARNVGNAFDAVFLRKLLQHVRKLYLSSEPRNFSGSVELPARWQELGELVNWMCACTSHLITKAGGDAVRADLAPLANAAAILKKCHDSLKTYFGWRADWVPSLPLETMYKLFSDSYPMRARLESTYLRMSAQLQDAEKRQAALDEARRAMDGAVALHKQRASMLAAELDDKLPKQLANAKAKCLTAHKALLEKLDAFKQVVQTHFQCPSMDDLLKGAESMAFTISDPKGAAAMAGVQVLGMVNTGMTKIRTNTGKDLSKLEVVDEIVTMGENLKDSATQSLIEKDADGKPHFTNASKVLITSLDKFRNEVQSLTKELDQGFGSDGSMPSQTLARAIDDFESAITEKGEAQLTTAFHTLRLIEELDELESAEQKKAQLDDQLDPSSPVWAEAVAYLASVYQSSLEKCAESVAMMERKVAYLSLCDGDNIDVLDELDGIWSGTVPTQENVDELAARVTKLKESVANHASSGLSSMVRIPCDDKRRSDLHLRVTDPDLLADLCRHGSLTLHLQRQAGDDPASRHAGEMDVANAHHFYDVRVLKATPRLFGVKTRSGLVSLGIRAAASSKIYSLTDREFQFSTHYAREANVTHKQSSRPDDDGNDDLGSGSDGRLVDEYLDAPGLYGAWTVSIGQDRGQGDNNEGFDASGLSELRIDFTVMARQRASAAIAAEGKTQAQDNPQ